MEPFYPVHLVRIQSWSKGQIGNAALMVGGWTIRFSDGALEIAEPDGICVIRMGKEDTERFVDLVLALDAGRTDALYVGRG